MSDRTNVYESVTARIVALLEQGVRPWFRPWNGTHPAGSVSRPLRSNYEPYSGINVLVLWLEAEAKGYSSPLWVTFRQCQELGGHVKKGEHGSRVVYASRFKKTEEGENGEAVEREIPFLKTYTVFSVEQTEGLPSHFYAEEGEPLPESARIARAEEFVAQTKADIRHGGSRAFYSQATDHVQLPNFASFHSGEAYAVTAFHELGHWTRHPSRLNRDFGQKGFGDPAYALEELVCELASCYLAADLQIEAEPAEQHAAYIGNWLKALKDDSRSIFRAASYASRAVDYLWSLQPDTVTRSTGKSRPAESVTPSMDQCPVREQ